MRTTAILLAGLFTTACAAPALEDDDDECVGDKCDSPLDTGHDAEEMCTARRSDALDSGQKAYTPTSIRWACSDVAGVNTNNKDSRGQEYCEYFAIVQPPPATEGGNRPPAVDLGRKTSASTTTALSLTLAEDQVFWLEDHPSDVIGQCVFTSWHSDVGPAYPACKNASSCPDVMGFKITSEFMQMKDSVNSNLAANDLVVKCYKEPGEDDMPDGIEVPDDDYTRGCMISAKNWGTEWRRSDPTICAAAMRLKECGCGVDTNGDGSGDLYGKQLADGLVPAQPDGDSGTVTLRGFKLGTWSGASALPAGCRYVSTGDSSQTLVTCDLTADDVLKNKTDPKGACRSKYADDIVVHIPLPGDKVVCKPPADGKHTETCTDNAWIL